MLLRQQLPRLLAPLTRAAGRLRPGARILMYHRVNDLGYYDQLTVSPDLFEAQMQWLHQHREVVSLETLLQRLQSRTITPGLVSVTFDDGYLDNLQLALPILERYSIPATIYVTSRFAAQEINHYRYSDENQRLHLDWQEVQSLDQHPLIRIGSHTVSHPMLSELSDADAATEISHSRREIESHLEQPVADFCYPSGNFSDRERQLVASSGYTSAVTVKPGANPASADRFSLRRTEVTDRDTIDMFALKLDGAFDPIHRLLDWRRERQFASARRRAKNTESTSR